MCQLAARASLLLLLLLLHAPKRGQCHAAPNELLQDPRSSSTNTVEGIYVCPSTGNDDAGFGGKSSPLRTLPAALSMLRARRNDPAKISKTSATIHLLHGTHILSAPLHLQDATDSNLHFSGEGAATVSGGVTFGSWLNTGHAKCTGCTSSAVARGVTDIMTTITSSVR